MRLVSYSACADNVISIKILTKIHEFIEAHAHTRASTHTHTRASTQQLRMITDQEKEQL